MHFTYKNKKGWFHEENKKILSIILAVMMILTAVPLAGMTAFAASVDCETCGGVGNSNPLAVQLLADVTEQCRFWQDGLTEFLDNFASFTDMAIAVHDLWYDYLMPCMDKIEEYNESYKLANGYSSDSVYYAVDDMWSTIDWMYMILGEKTLDPSLYDYVSECITTTDDALSVVKDEVEKTACPDCGGTGKIASAHTHTFATEWTTNETAHWHESLT